MRLKHITFTGIDIRTDIKALIEIQSKFPIVEFGVLIAGHYGNRCPDIGYIKELANSGLNLSLHACGRYTQDLIQTGSWDIIREASNGLIGFNRCQLNVSGRKPKSATETITCPPELKEIIIQQRPDDTRIFDAINNKQGVSILMDSSGGRGIDTDIIPFNYHKVGYAGGIYSGNVYEKLSTILSLQEVSDFWIDMESGVRTDDWFDLHKVIKVLELCNQLVPIKQ